MTTNEQKPIFVVHRTWQAIRLLGSGSNGEVYAARHAYNNTMVALKSEHPSQSSLDDENLIFGALDEAGNPTGFPRRLFYGMHHGRNPRRVLVMDMLGGSLLAPMGPDEDKPLTLNTVLRFGMQALRRIQTLHGLGYLHRDVKPDNFCVGREGSGQERTVHLIDFGNVQRFMVENDGQERHMRFHKERMHQTPLYGSEKATRGYTVGRRDDLESLIYSMVYMATAHLPWDKYYDYSNRSHVAKAGKMKASKTTQRALFNGLPVALEEAYQYVRSLSFSEDPRYDHIYHLFDTALSQIHGHSHAGVEIPLD